MSKFKKKGIIVEKYRDLRKRVFILRSVFDMVVELLSFHEVWLKVVPKIVLCALKKFIIVIPDRPTERIN